MCEVNSCCCLSLRQGCVLIGGITIVVSLVQTLIFSWVLLETYLSYQSIISVTADNATSDSSSASYYFSSATCPIGFLPVASKSNPTNFSDDYYENEDSEDEDSTQQTLLTVVGDTSSPPSSTSSLTLESRLEEISVVMSSTTTISSLSQSPKSASVLGNDGGILVLSSSQSLPEVESNNTHIESSASSATPKANSTASATPNVSRRTPRITCAAPGQGVLWALVVVSALYSLAGGLLIVAVLWCVSWQLSIWFFYTVGFDLFMLIVAMADGVYTSFSDISSYVVCLVTTYCVIVVDSYYEKLLHDERLEKAGQGRRQSSLVIVRSSPDSPTCQQEYIPPTTFTLTSNHNNLVPPPVALGAPPIIAPQPVTLVPPPVSLAPPPVRIAPPPLTRQVSHHTPTSPTREVSPNHLPYAYHNNV
ncbi:hypothetical protein OTU49_015664 [Cherax quadricarinatus]|uniref:Uncharacterized protein n=1 Tax=Cherax quadricarinatus TaxID=27406 RepID=A0AAW0YBQ2_CHEQU|nr:uncharacterized protein LOC128687944 isoform X1 [Cherax quadricarinatus]